MALRSGRVDLDYIAQWGVGTPNEGGRFPRYAYPPEFQAAKAEYLQELQGDTPTESSMQPREFWAHVLSMWSHIECDLHQFYGLDLGDPHVWDSRTWRWLRSRIVGLLGVTGSRLFVSLRGRNE